MANLLLRLPLPWSIFPPPPLSESNPCLQAKIPASSLEFESERRGGGVEEKKENGRVDTYKNRCVDTYKNGCVDTYKNGRVDT